MKNQMVLIIDTDKLTKEEWAELWRKCVNYAARIREDDYNKITDFVNQLFGKKGKRGISF